MNKEELTEEIKEIIDSENSGLSHQQSLMEISKLLKNENKLMNGCYNNSNHLKWIYNRLIEVYDESLKLEYMRKLQEVIDQIYKTEDELYKYIISKYGK